MINPVQCFKIMVLRLAGIQRASLYVLYIGGCVYGKADKGGKETAEIEEVLCLLQT